MEDFRPESTVELYPVPCPETRHPVKLGTLRTYRDLLQGTSCPAGCAGPARAAQLQLQLPPSTALPAAGPPSRGRVQGQKITLEKKLTDTFLLPKFQFFRDSAGLILYCLWYEYFIC